MSQATTTTAELDEVVVALRGQERFLVTTHENPDGDALGSLLGLSVALRALGKDVSMYLAGEAPLPAEYGFLPFGDLLRKLPDDLADRVLVAVDCANEDRISSEPLPLERAKLVVNVDHHHDNSRFGAVNLIVADASSTAEVVRDILRGLDVTLTPEIASPLYVGLVTDTGRFQYANTSAKSLRLAAELVEAGADVHGIFRHVYETVQFAKLKLLARVLDRAQLFEGGRLVVSHLLRSDFEASGAEEPYSEGLIDFLRSVEGSEMVALIRETPAHASGPSLRVSLRSSHDEVDVSAIARNSGGGGHRQAAGFSSEKTVAEVIEFLRREFLLATADEGTSGTAAGA